MKVVSPSLSPPPSPPSSVFCKDKSHMIAPRHENWYCICLRSITCEIWAYDRIIVEFCCRVSFVQNILIWITWIAMVILHVHFAFFIVFVLQVLGFHNVSTYLLKKVSLLVNYKNKKISGKKKEKKRNETMLFQKVIFFLNRWCWNYSFKTTRQRRWSGSTSLRYNRERCNTGIRWHNRRKIHRFRW